MSVRELIDRRNALVVRERELAAEADKNGYSVETRKNLDAIDKDLTEAQGDVERALRAEGRDFQPERKDQPRNDPGTPVDSQDPKVHAEKVNREVRAMIMSRTAGAYVFPYERRDGLEANLDNKGGYLVDQTRYDASLIEAVKDQVFMEGLASVYSIPQNESIEFPRVVSGFTNAVWDSELRSGNTDTGATYGSVTLTPHPQTAKALVSKKLLRSGAIDVAGHVIGELAYALSIPREIAYLNGSGSNQPLGLFTVHANGVSTGQDFTSASSSKVIADFTDLINTQYKLKGAHWRNSAWTFNRFHHQDIRKMLDGNGNPVWMPAGLGSVLNAVAYDTLLTRPVYMSEYAPVSTAYGSSVQTEAITGSTGAITGRVACFGDYSRYYIANAQSLELQHLTELKAETNQDLFLARVETDGAPVLSEAFAFLRLKGY
ncbi:MAG: phage major capsid protein [Gemmatimonadaceae bacterium]|nr:phage major capsid protein [Gemmatimonadaceae bacterium]